MQGLGGGEKTVIGTPGTPFPNRDKNTQIITFVLDQRHVVFTDQKQEEIQRKVDGRYDGIRIKFKKSGTSSKGMFENQAIIAEVRGGALPINDDDIHRIQAIIERSEDLLEVAQIIIDQE